MYVDAVGMSEVQINLKVLFFDIAPFLTQWGIQVAADRDILKCVLCCQAGNHTSKTFTSGLYVKYSFFLVLILELLLYSL